MDTKSKKTALRIATGIGAGLAVAFLSTGCDCGMSGTKTLDMPAPGITVVAPTQTIN